MKIISNAQNGGGSDIVELWSNSSPTSNFATTSIPLDLSGYRFVKITTSAGSGVFELGVGDTGYMLYGYPRSSGGVAMAYRQCDATTTKVKIYDCQYGYTGANATVNNALIIPLKIYGVK